MADDRRAALQAAFEEAEVVEDKVVEPVTQEPVSEETHGDDPAPAPAPTDAKAPTPAPAPKDTDSDSSEKASAVDKAPQSWRPAQKAKWDKLEPDVRQEIVRRERETAKVLSDSAQSRQLAGAFQEVVQPYMARIQAMGVHPVAAAQELFKADHILTTAPKGKRAEFMARLIKDYDVDIEALDQALSGTPQADPIQSKVDQLLQERLAPFMSFMQNQTASQQERQQAESRAMSSQIEAMSLDPKYAEFDNVRQDMADIVDIQAKRGVYLTLEQAYDRAVAMNPEVRQRVSQQNSNLQRTAAAREANARAQRALRASSSVSGSPGDLSSGPVSGDDRRATIAAAFAQAEGR